MKNEEKLVSVIVSSYNTKEIYLKQMIESILNQTYKNFELIIIDDGSSNPISKILNHYKDDRIRLIENQVNLGVTKSRNRALDLCRGDYIAIMDADDIALPKRLETQVKYLEKHKNTFVVGTQRYLLEGEKLFEKKIYIPKKRKRYQVWLFFDNSRYIPHPSAMIRASFLKKYNIKYNEKYKKALDYRLWVDCIKYGDCVLLKKYLIKYRIHSQQITQCNAEEQHYYADRICIDQLSDLDIIPTEEEIKIHLALRDCELYDNYQMTKKWINKLIEQNNNLQIYCKKEFKEEIEYRWFKLCLRNYKSIGTLESRKEFYESLKIKYVIRAVKFYLINKILSRKKLVTLREG